MKIPEKIVADVLSRSGRHCIVCRNFSPLTIQIHHIVELSAGGTNELDNLIPVCITCHSHIHTATQMTRSFSALELKKSREQVYELVTAGKLPAKYPLTAQEIEGISSALSQAVSKEVPSQALTKDAMNILTTCILEDADVGVFNVPFNNHYAISIGNHAFFTNEKGEAQYPSFIMELLNLGHLVSCGQMLSITDKARKLVSSVVHTTETYVEKKVKCAHCGLHFILCTWYMDRHNTSNIHCPECGQSDGDFFVWAEVKFGFIFEAVPAKGYTYGLPESLVGKPE
ncbi:HNH endonuclease [Vibrio coralliilyticus]|uniref:HNH endonuclease n=1 Tax=Vibrio coralliilyticus TaxID=190893 RepID=UPI000BAC2541|nr:HNH endonuclease signature motif containing protein [Vibrio coralliilyticus]NOI75331.1 HNH endonuclease [Vibrio coralliilyticus]PAW04164.1 hypothetical protein CKJ79_05360 [Vibrio coralliilyticus]